MGEGGRGEKLKMQTNTAHTPKACNHLGGRKGADSKPRTARLPVPAEVQGLEAKG